MAQNALGDDIVWIPSRFALTGFSAGRPATPDPADLARDAAAALDRRLGRALPVLFATQVHGAVGYVYGRHDRLAPGAHHVGRCDALYTAEDDVVLLVRTADCLPIALASGEAIGLVHAGWRGLAADILGAAVRRFANEFGVAAASLDATIGPAIGPCHYPVGAEVVQALAALKVADDGWLRGDCVDLARWARGRLAELGVTRDRIDDRSRCTACDPALASYRRDGAAAGRQWAVITRVRAEDR